MYFFLGIFFFCLAGLYLIIIICLFNKIRVAIAINKVAAKYVYHNKPIIFVPIVGSLILLLWFLFWVFCALFIVSQTSDEDYDPGPFTYRQAAGTSDEEGMCNNKFPSGSPWYDQMHK